MRTEKGRVRSKRVPEVGVDIRVGGRVKDADTKVGPRPESVRK